MNYLGEDIKKLGFGLMRLPQKDGKIDIEQTNIMKLFTLITAIFLPLTLMVGWYGMNFKYMYELDSIYGYPVFIVVSFIVCVLLILYFKKKRWF